jgi:hypothetical protein
MATTITLDCLHCAEIDSQYPSSTNTGSCDVGYYSGKINNCFFDFESITSAIPAGSTINSAYLKIKQVSGGYNNNQNIDITLRSGAWFTPTWNSQPANTAAGTINGTIPNYSAVLRTYTVTSLVQWAITNATNAHIFKVARDPNTQTGSLDAKRFSITESNHSLVITYTTGTSKTVYVTDRMTAAVDIEVPTVTATEWAHTPRTVSAPLATATAAFKDAPHIHPTTSKRVILTDAMRASALNRGAWGPYTGERDIDGFVIYVHQADDDAAPYTFGSDLTKEQMWIVPYNARFFRIPGLPANKYYHFQIKAYRHVDDDINASGTIFSSAAQFPENGYATTMSHVTEYSGTFKPLTNYAPTNFTGLYGNDTNLGYIDQGVWKTYQDKYGHVYFVGPPGTDNSFTWDGEKVTIVTDDPDGGLVVKGGAVRSFEKDSYESIEDGFWMGKDPSDSIYKLNIGGAQDFLKWDGVNLTVSGNISASYGRFSDGTSEYTGTYLDPYGISVVATRMWAGSPLPGESIDWYIDGFVEGEINHVGSIYANYIDDGVNAYWNLVPNYPMFIGNLDLSVPISFYSGDAIGGNSNITVWNATEMVGLYAGPPGAETAAVVVQPEGVTIAGPLTIDGGVTHIRAGRISSGFTLTNATYTTIPWNSAVTDTLGELNTTTGEITIQNSGYYLISAALQTASISFESAEVFALGIYNGSSLVQVGQLHKALGTTTSQVWSSTITATLYFAANDVLTIRAYQNSDANQTSAYGIDSNWVTVARLLG